MRPPWNCWRTGCYRYGQPFNAVSSSRLSSRPKSNHFQPGRSWDDTSSDTSGSRNRSPEAYLHQSILRRPGQTRTSVGEDPRIERSLIDFENHEARSGTHETEMPKGRVMEPTILLRR